MKKILKKQKKLPPEVEKMSEAIDKIYLEIIEELSLERQKLKNWISYYGLNQY